MMSSNTALLFAVFLMLSSLAAALLHQQTDEQTLLSFKRQVISDPLECLANWNPENRHFCNWTGVSCSSDDSRVVGLNLTGMLLQSPLPALLANMSYLHMLDLSTNGFHGKIPAVLGSLKSLQVLNLAGNYLNSKIPSALSNLSALVVLDVSGNNLSGIIPPQLGMLKYLYTLDLSENQLSGTIPSSLSNLSSLADLILYHNYFRGQIPWQFGINLGKLENLNLWGNMLSGTIPKTLGNCSSLIKFIASSNNLNGSIPVELGNLSFLVRLKLHKNQLDSGSDFGNKFITALTNCSSLEQLTLSFNKFTGMLPDSIGRLSRNLSVWQLTNNSLSGNIPLQIGNLSRLTYLALDCNHVTGRIPGTIRTLRNLERLQLQNNLLEGKIPGELAELSSLGVFDVSYNKLSGQIPNAIASLKQLRQLILHHNYLTGSIPSSLEYCYNLELLDISYNALSGIIPKEVGKLSYIQLYINFSSNLLEGQLPVEISNMMMAQAIDVSSNKLTGPIPSQIASCSGLQWLNLSRNYFSGSIPNEIGNLKSILSLDLSSNNLSGTIPVSVFNGLTLLRYLNLSFNMFTGKIQEEDFSNRNISTDLQGNPGLCGSQHFNIAECRISGAHSKKLWILFPAISVTTLMCVLVIIFWKVAKRKFLLLEFQSRSSRLQELLYEELSEATNGFSEANLIGRGSYGSVYKGVLSNGQTVAVKVISLLNDEIKKSFTAECNILSSIRHRNLVKLLSSFSTSNLKGLVYEYMTNGSLEDHLYCGADASNDHVECKLTLVIRLSIATDIAHALEYLHCDSFVQVVHCDIKPPNVLLDEDMTAHLSDFGISRLIEVQSGESAPSTISMRGTMGYIAPEYGVDGRISTEGDVYSFGILLLEMLTRKKPTSELFVENLNLHNWVGMSFPERIHEIIDPCLLKQIKDEGIDENRAFDCLTSLIQVGLLCSNERPQSRPTIRQVSRILESSKANFMGY